MKTTFDRGVSSKNWDLLRKHFSTNAEGIFQGLRVEFENMKADGSLNTYVSNYIKKFEASVKENGVKAEKPSRPTRKNQRLLAEMKAKNVTMEDLAHTVGVTRGSIQNAVDGRHLPRVDVAIRMAKALGATVEDIFEGTL